MKGEVKTRRRGDAETKNDVMNDAAHDVRASDACPRCGAGRMRAWDGLSEKEREVVLRLPASADFTFEERARRHRWCVRCWHEEMRAARRAA